MKLDDDEVTARLDALQHWAREDDKIVRRLQFPSFLDAIAFINRVAPLAEAADHHPELFNVYDRVVIELTTHDADGLTEKDFALAAAIDQVVDG